MKILIVEDEPALASVLKEKLEASRFTVAVASDGDAALPKAISFQPDAIILDLILPKKDGFAVLELLKKEERTKAVPVIVVSNLGEDYDIKRALGLGAVDYFVKTEHPLLEIVEKIKALVIKAK